MILLLAAWGHASTLVWTNGAGGDFQTPGNWDSNMVPGAGDVAVFNLASPAYTVTWSGTLTNDAFRVEAGTVTWDLQGATYFLANSAQASSVGTSAVSQLTVTNGLVRTVSANFGRQFKLVRPGTTMRVLANTRLQNASYLNLAAGTTLILDGANARADSGITYMAAWLGSVVVTNGGYLTVSQGSSMGANGSLKVTGPGVGATVTIGTLAAGGSVLAESGGEVAHATQTAQNWYGTITLNDGRYYYATINTTAGKACLIGASAVLQGSGSLEFNSLVNSNGVIRPGGAGRAGTLRVTGGLSNAVPGGGTVAIELGGTATNQYDRLQLAARGALSQTLWAGGTLDVTLIDGFTPSDGDSFDILDFSDAVGAFDAVNLPAPAWNWDTNALYTTGVILYAPPAGLDPPTGVAASDGEHTDKVVVTWDVVAPATGYEVWRSLSADTGTAVQVGQSAGTSYDDVGTAAGVTNTYWVKATNATSVSDFSVADTGWKAESLPVPDVPTNVSASDGVYVYQGLVVVAWSAASNATGYAVWRGSGADTGTASQIAGTEALTWNDTTAVAGVTNTYWIRATNSAHMSDFGVPDTGWMAPVPPLSITWTNPAGGDFQTAANWSPQFVPGSLAGITNIAVFSLTTQPYTVTWSGPITTEAVRVTAGRVTWDLQGHTYSLANGVHNSIFGTASTAGEVTVTNGILYTINASYGRFFTLAGTGTTLRVVAGSALQRACYPNVGAGSRLLLDGGTAGFFGYMTGFSGEIAITNNGYLSAADGVVVGAGGILRASGAGLRGVVVLTSLNAGGVVQLDPGAQLYDGAESAVWYGTVTLDGARYYYPTVYNPPTAGRALLSGASALLQGSGLLDFNGLVNSNGTIRPGGSGRAGTLLVSGSLSNAAPGSGVIEIELGGPATNEYDRLFLVSRGTLPRTLWAGGALNVTFTDGFVPAEGMFKILDFSSAPAMFDAVSLPGRHPELRWDLSQLYITGELRYRALPQGSLLLVR